VSTKQLKDMKQLPSIYGNAQGKFDYEQLPEIPGKPS
jgi:hypothetical protein